jgi:AcrR family transcriptional regulator
MATRTRRSTAEVQRLILEAATRVFERKGYAQTTTDDIAAEAGVARSVMFRHFTSKAELFRAAELQPFIDLVTTFTESLDAQADELWDEERMMRTVVEIVYDSFRSHRNGVLALALMHASDEDAFRDAQAVLNQTFADVAELSTEHNRRRGWAPQRNLEMSIRMVIGMVASIAVLDPLFVPSGRRRPSRAQLIDHVTAVALHGIRAESASVDTKS